MYLKNLWLVLAADLSSSCLLAHNEMETRHLSWWSKVSLPQVTLIFFNSVSTVLLQTRFGHLRWRFLYLRGFKMSPSWRHIRQLLKLHPLLVMVTSMHSCPVCSTSCLFEKVSVQKIFTALRIHLSCTTFWQHSELYSEVHLTGSCYSFSLDDTAEDLILHNSCSDGCV